MHVLLVTHHYVPETGAPQRRWAAFVERFVAAGHRVTVMTPPPHYPTGRAGDLAPDERPGAVCDGRYGETVVRVRFREHGPGLLSRSADQAVAAGDTFARAVRRFAGRRDRPDVVIATAPGIPSIPTGMALGVVLRRPAVVEMRDAWPDLIASSGMLGPGSGTGPRAVATSVAHRSMTSLQRHADAVVTTTASFADVLRDRGIRRVRVIRNGTHAAAHPTLPLPDRPTGTLRVVYAGTLGRSQGLGTAVTAARLARDNGVDVHLRIAGSGADEPALESLVAETAAPVDLVGRLPAEEVPDLYAWADTALVALRSWEPFGWTVPSKLYEVLATGRHVTASIAGEAARIVMEARAGHVVAPEDPAALARLWQDLAAHRHLLDVGLRGRRWVETNAEHDHLAAEYLDLLEGIAS